jgi:hypothetical protein
LDSSAIPTGEIGGGTSPAQSDPDAPTYEAVFTKPFIGHASLMPSCALAHWTGQRLDIWTHSQGPYNLRADLALVFPDTDIVVHHAEGAGSMDTMRPMMWPLMPPSSHAPAARQSGCSGRGATN